MTEKKKTNAWTWPLVALIGLLTVVLVGTVVAVILGGY